MKLLILGASDSDGKLLPNFADAWREILRLELPPLLGEELEIEHRRYYVHLPGPLDYLERCLTETTPDLVVMAATGYAFSTRSVGNHMRNRFGKGTGDWIERRLSTFDRATSGPEGSLRDRVNTAAHRLARSTVGQQGVSTFDQVFDVYARTVERLARIEDLDVIVMGTTYNGPTIQRRVPELKTLVDRFNREFRAIVIARHFTWVDRQALIDELPRDTARPDQLHAGRDIHRKYADSLKPIIVELSHNR